MARYRTCLECGARLNDWQTDYCEECLEFSFLTVEEEDYEDWDDEDDDWHEGDDPFVFFHDGPEK